MSLILKLNVHARVLEIQVDDLIQIQCMPKPICSRRILDAAPFALKLDTA